jgi:hypothetical protein
VTGRGPVVSNEPVEQIEEPKVDRQQPKRKPKSARKKQ